MGSEMCIRDRITRKAEFLKEIKAPLEEMVERQQVKQAGEDNLKMALRSVNNLLRLVTDLINFERSDMYTPQLYIG